MSLGQNILSGFLNSALSPSVTEGLHVDKDGNFVDSNGNPTSPYQKPSFLARTLSPDAHNAYLMNQEASMAPAEAQRQEALKETTGASEFGQLPEDYFNNTPLGGLNNRQRFIASNGNPSFTNLRPITAAKANIETGVPKAEANEALNSAIAGAEESKNRAVNAAVRGLLGSPALGASVENEGLGLEGSKIAGERTLLPAKLGLEGLNIGNETTSGIGLKSRLPTMNNTLGQQAQMENEVTSEQNREMPNTLYGMGNRSVLDSYSSQFAPTPMPFSLRANGNTVTKGRNPMGMNPMMAASPLGDMGMGGGEQSITTKSGLVLPPQTPSFTAPTGRQMQDGVPVINKGNSDIAVPHQPPAQGASSEKTGNYIDLIQAANEIARTKGRNSPEYAQALAKIHSKEEEEFPSALGDDGNASLPFALGSVTQDSAHGLGRLTRKAGQLYTRPIVEGVRSAKKLGKSFLSGLQDEE